MIEGQAVGYNVISLCPVKKKQKNKKKRIIGFIIARQPFTDRLQLNGSYPLHLEFFPSLRMDCLDPWQTNRELL